MLNLRRLFYRRSLALSSPSPTIISRRLQHRTPERQISQIKSLSKPSMVQETDSVPHVDRTASEPRDPNLHSLELVAVRKINSTVRLFKLRASESGVKFQPGQWLDVYLPGVDQAGGFTITSTPAHAAPVTSKQNENLNIDPSSVEEEQNQFRPYLELAVQQSPNKPAAWLWQPAPNILHSRIEVRVGGSFVWPPPTSAISTQEIQKAVLIAGGVGINPLISMISHMHHANTMPSSVEFIYATKLADGQVLFADRLLHIASNRPEQLKLKFFLTKPGERDAEPFQDIRMAGLSVSPAHRRLSSDDVLEALGDAQRDKTVCYVCGPPQMTDELVELLREQDGMSADRVLCEKWW